MVQAMVHMFSYCHSMSDIWPCNSANPFMGTLEVPVTNWSSLALISLSKFSTACVRRIGGMYIQYDSSHVKIEEFSASLHSKCCIHIKGKVWGPTVNGSLVIQHFKKGTAIRLCDRIIFYFYKEMPHAHCKWTHNTVTVELCIVGLRV